MNAIFAIIKDTPESSLTLSAMWEHSEKMAIYESESRHSPNTRSAAILNLDFPAFQPWEINFYIL